MEDPADIQSLQAALEKKLDGLRALVQHRQQAIPAEAQWTLSEARVRLSHGINAKALTEEELQEWLSDSRTMSQRTLKRLRDDEANPIRAIEVGGVKRIPEQLIDRYLRLQQTESQPESLKQI